MRTRYTTIHHEKRLEHDLSLTEYCLADSIHKLSQDPDYDYWCKASKQKLADFIGISRRQTITLINRLVSKGFVHKSDDGNHLRSTGKWTKSFVVDDNGKSCEESSRGCEETSQDRGEITSHPSNSSNVNSSNNIEGKPPKYEIPTQDQVEDYFRFKDGMLEEDIPLEAEKFVNHYEEREWRTSGGSGKRIENWHLQAGTWLANYKKWNKDRIQQKQEQERQPEYMKEL